MPAGTEHMALNGAFVATVNATGPVKTPLVTGALRLDDATIGDGFHPPVTGINVRAALDRDRLTLEVAEGHWQGAHAAIAGTVPARFLKVPGASPGGSASLTGHVDDVTIKVLEPFVSSDALKATDFNVRVEYTVGAQEPTVESAVADVRVVDASLSSKEGGITQECSRAPGAEQRRRNVGPVDARRQPARRSRHARGILTTLTGTPSVDGKIDGQFDLRTLALVLGSSRPSGKANLSAAIKGPLATPNIEGFVTLESAELLIRDPRLLFADIHGTVRFSGGQIDRGEVHGRAERRLARGVGFDAAARPRHSGRQHRHQGQRRALRCAARIPQHGGRQPDADRTAAGLTVHARRHGHDRRGRVPRVAHRHRRAGLALPAQGARLRRGPASWRRALVRSRSTSRCSRTTRLPSTRVTAACR